MKTMKTEVLVVGSGFGAMAPALRMASDRRRAAASAWDAEH